ncbi:MAG TPA: metal ABC transporter permease [Acholeplasma sp.]|nr:metal ABC transporter permease [Acholeplasma sp.]
MNIGILLILILTAIATSVLGVYLVLRKMSMMIDAISHTVLLGIVLAFMVIGNLSSPLLIIGAAFMGVVTVFLTELIVKSKQTSEDSAIGLVFPLLFSIAVIIISTSFHGVHLDIDSVLLGKIEFAPFDKLFVSGVSIGPKLLYMMLAVTVINLVFVKVFFKELKLVSFDSALATTLGFSPIILHYSLMTLVSLTSVAAFNAVGSILVVALMIGPASSAILITKDLKKTLLIAPIFGIINSVLGYVLAIVVDVNISGMIATVTLVTFLLLLIFEPKKGILTSIFRVMRQKDDFSFIILAMHLNNHDDLKEIDYNNIQNELNWSESKYKKQVDKGIKLGYFKVEKSCVYLTNIGLQFVSLKTNELQI